MCTGFRQVFKFQFLRWWCVLFCCVLLIKVQTTLVNYRFSISCFEGGHFVFTFDDEEYWQIKLGRFNLIVVPLFTACYLSLVSVFFCVCSLPRAIWHKFRIRERMNKPLPCPTPLFLYNQNNSHETYQTSTLFHTNLGKNPPSVLKGFGRNINDAYTKKNWICHCKYCNTAKPKIQQIPECCNWKPSQHFL